MKLVMVTPHLPPHQAANALLPHLLGKSLGVCGHEVGFLTMGPGPDRPDAVYIKRRPLLRLTRVPQALEAAETIWKGRSLLRSADVVHIHSNTWMNQVAARLSVRERKPYVLTHYGTEIWHHDGRNRAFRRLNRDAHHVTFYSEALLAKAVEMKVPMRASSVIYPAVADEFRPPDPALREAVRRRYDVSTGCLLLNVKRLHPLADQATLLEAVAQVRRARGDVVLLIAGTGETEGALRSQAARLGIEAAVRFLGLVPNEEVCHLQGAADLFVLSSRLEATPTVALEALAVGTPVLSTDSPGGVELQEIFGDDVAIVRKQDPRALAEGILEFLRAPRRASQGALRIVEERFRLARVVERYLALYRGAAGS